MEAAIAHVQEFWIGYAVLGGCLAVLAVIFQRYTAPFIFYTIEFSIYMISMHVVMWTLVRVTHWFKMNSSMELIGTRDPDVPDWQTPLIEFWDQAAYNPQWIFWFEITVAVIVFLVMLRFRPLRPQRRKDRRAASEKVRNVKLGDSARYGRSGPVRGRPGAGVAARRGR